MTLMKTNFLDEILGSFESGEGLSAEVTAQLATKIIESFSNNDDIANSIGLGRTQAKQYFSVARDANIYRAFLQCDRDVQRLLGIINGMDRVRAINSNTPAYYVQQALSYGLGVPSSKSAIYRIVQDFEDDHEFISRADTATATQ